MYIKNIIELIVVWIVVYGSLLNPKEFKNKNHVLVIVKGWRRIFNKVASRSVWRKYIKENEKATLNVEKEKNSYFNGIVYEVSDKEFSKLVEREQDYHIEKVDVYDFESSKKLFAAFIFVSNEKNKDGEKILRNDIKPIREYLEICRNGAYAWGERFGKEFDKTTFLADGKTTIQEFLNLK